MRFRYALDGNLASQVFSPPTKKNPCFPSVPCRGGKQQHCSQRNQVVVGYQLVQEHHSRDFMLLESVLVCLYGPFLLTFIFKFGGILLDTYVA